MPEKKDAKLPRGVYEHPRGSGNYWIQYRDIEGKRRRQKMGRLSDATKELDKLKEQIKFKKSAKRAGVYIEPPKAGPTLSELIDDVLQFVADENYKDQRTYHSRGEILR